APRSGSCCRVILDSSTPPACPIPWDSPTARSESKVADRSEPISPIPGVVVQLDPFVRRLTAPNPSIMTGPGTNTYLVGEDSLAVIDPGPDIEDHLSRI